MENFKKIFEAEKKKYLLQEDNIIHRFFNYILNDIVENYNIGYIFYISLEEKFSSEKENIFKLSLVINIYFYIIDIIFNLPFCLDIDVTGKTLSIHKIFNETITTLGMMFSINHLMKIHLSILNIMDINKIDVINNILPLIDESINLIDGNLEDDNINDILSNNKNKKEIFTQMKMEKKKKYLEVVLRYIEILDNRNVFSKEKHESLCNFLKNKNTNVDNIFKEIKFYLNK